MEIILMENVEKLGRVGDVVKVKDGYARNYLLPRQLGVAANAGNVKRIEKEKQKRLAVYEAEKQEAVAQAEQLSKVSVTIAVEVNDQEHLYGAISDSDIIDAIHKEGQQVERKNLVIEKALNTLGAHEVGIKLHPEVIANIRVWVTKKA